MSKTSLHSLKAAMVLAQIDAKWWEGIVTVPGHGSFVVLQVPANKMKETTIILKAYKVKPPKPIPGTEPIFPIRVEYLTMDEPEREPRRWLPRGDGPHDEWKGDVVKALDREGIRYVRMEFSGAGDSANDDDWDCRRSPEPWYPETWDDSNELGGRKWHEASKHKLDDITAGMISEYVWEKLIQWDVVNNDGGGGDLTIDLRQDEPEFKFSCYVNEMVRHDEAVDEEV